LHVEILYNEYNYSGAFAAASLLSVVAVITLAFKKYLEWKSGRERVQEAGIE
jgi:sulfate transport system permease protein